LTDEFEHYRASTETQFGGSLNSTHDPLMTSPAVRTVNLLNQPSLFAVWPGVLATTLLRGRAQPVTGVLDVRSHLLAAVEWIVTAYANSEDGGIPAYFDLLRGRWRSSYPETTGYTIPTL